MTYNQSLKNIEILKNLVWPLNADYIFFDFYNSTDFKIIFLNQNESQRIEDYIQEKFRAKQPFTHIRITSTGQEVLYYEDITIRFEYNLTTHEVLKNDLKNFKKKCPTQVKLDMAKLLLKLKNM